MSVRELNSTANAALAYSGSATVIIPTYNRVDTLLTCLRRLEGQSFKDFEVVLVDDGSSDGTAAVVEDYLKTTPLRMRFVRQSNGGPAKARNAAIALAGGRISIMIGDDIFASPEFVANHVRLHEEHPETGAAGLGLTRWSSDGQRLTPFMRWMDEGGLQFSYGELLAGTRADWRHFYTSNLSLKTELLKANLFDERFRVYGMEDMELGYRLEQRAGLQMHFLPGAEAEHVHPTTFARCCRRMYAVGWSTQMFHRLWPEHAPGAGSRVRRAVREALLRVPWMLAPLTALTDKLTERWCPNPLMQPLLDWSFAAGYRSGERKGDGGAW